MPFVYRDGSYYGDEFQYNAVNICRHCEEEMEGLECTHSKNKLVKCCPENCPVEAFKKETT